LLFDDNNGYASAPQCYIYVYCLSCYETSTSQITHILHVHKQLINMCSPGSLDLLLQRNFSLFNFLLQPTNLLCNIRPL